MAPVLREYQLSMRTPKERIGNTDCTGSHFHSTDSHTPLREEIINVGENRLLVIQEQMGSIQFVIVPGYINRTYEEKGNTVAECETVPESKRGELSDIIRQHGFQGPINF